MTRSRWLAKWAKYVEEVILKIPVRDTKADRPEKIPYTAPTLDTILFSLNDRDTKYLNPRIEVFSVEDNGDGTTTERRLDGVIYTIIRTTDTDLVNYIIFDDGAYIDKNGYILLF